METLQDKNSELKSGFEANSERAESNEVYIIGAHNRPVLNETKIKFSFMKQLMPKNMQLVNNSSL